jgi:hypothetical protein
MYSLQTLHIGHVYMMSLKRIHRTCLYAEFEENTLDMFIWRAWREYIGHVYMQSLKRIHRTCLYEEFEENTLDMFIWRAWRKKIGHVFMKSMYSLQTLHINMSYVFSSSSSYKHVLYMLFKLFILTYEEFEEST